MKAAKFAVIVPAASTVAAVEELVADEKVIDVVEEVHELKEYPELAVALIVSEPPESTQVLVPTAGEVVPPAPAAIVTWNWVVHWADSLIGVSMVTEVAALGPV